MTGPFLSSRDTLAAALADHRWNAIDFACECGWAPTAGSPSRPQREEHTAAALIASGVVVTPDVYLAGLAEDSRFCHRVAQQCGEGATKVFAAAAALAPTTEETGT